MSMPPIKEHTSLRKIKKTTYKKRGIWLSAMRDKEGHLWFGTENKQLEKYDPLNRESRYYTTEFGTFSIFCDRTGRIWTGSKSGLYFLDPDTDTLRTFERYNGFPQLRESAIYHLYEDKEGIWIGSSSGLYLLEPGKGITTRYAKDEAFPYRIPYDFILHFHRDTTGIFWLATRGGGLIRLNPDDGTYRQFTTTEGLSNNILYAVYEDAYKRLWLPSNHGLMLFDKKDSGVRTYFESDGIAHNEFNTHSHYRDDTGLLYFGGLSGITIVDPEKFPIDIPTQVPLRITSCKVLNGKTGILADKTLNVLASKGLDISPSETSVALEFTLLNYKQSRKNNYSYRIEGLDPTWTALGETNGLRLSRLPYGNYTLEVKGRDSDGIVSANELSIPIRVHRPFYLKRSFVISSIFVLILLIYGIFRWRLRQLHQSRVQLQSIVRERTREISLQKEKIEGQAEKLLEMDRAKSRFFANISHELRTPLTLISSPVRHLLNSKKDPLTPQQAVQLKMVAQNAGQLKNLVNDILDLSKLESDKLELQEDTFPLIPFLRKVISNFGSLAQHLGICYEMTSDLPEDLHVVLDKDKVEKIINNLLSNAIKHTPSGGSVQFTVTKEGGMLQFRVIDTGQGIPEEDLPYIFDRYFQSKKSHESLQGGTGIGLALARELTQLMNGTLRVESILGKGSTFLLNLPYKETAAIDMSDTETGFEDDEDSLTSIEKEAITATDRTHSILIVEDHPDMQRFIRQLLEHTYHIFTASHGKQALEILGRESIDLIVSDVMMPEMDGYALFTGTKRS